MEIHQCQLIYFIVVLRNDDTARPRDIRATTSEATGHIPRTIRYLWHTKFDGFIFNDVVLDNQFLSSGR